MIEKTVDDWWICSEDQHIGYWVKTEGNLEFSMDRELRNIAASYIKPGSIAIDIGANIGSWTHRFIRAAGRDGIVYAFEPGAEACTCLSRNCPEAICINKALSNKTSKGSLRKVTSFVGSSYMSSGLSLNTWAENQTGEEESVEVDVLDQYTFAWDISFIKIDVEGCEPQVLEGAAGTLAKHKPMIMLESNKEALAVQGNSVEKLIETIVKVGYVITKIYPEWRSQCDLICRPLP